MIWFVSKTRRLRMMYAKPNIIFALPVSYMWMTSVGQRPGDRGLVPSIFGSLNSDPLQFSFADQPRGIMAPQLSRGGYPTE